MTPPDDESDDLSDSILQYLHGTTLQGRVDVPPRLDLRTALQIATRPSGWRPPTPADSSIAT